MSTLYTMPNCTRCQQARELLTPGSYAEVALEGETEQQMRQRLGCVIAPVLERNGILYVLAQADGPVSWARIMGR